MTFDRYHILSEVKIEQIVEKAKDRFAADEKIIYLFPCIRIKWSWWQYFTHHPSYIPSVLIATNQHLFVCSENEDFFDFGAIEHRDIVKINANYVLGTIDKFWIFIKSSYANVELAAIISTNKYSIRHEVASDLNTYWIRKISKNSDYFAKVATFLCRWGGKFYREDEREFIYQLRWRNFLIAFVLAIPVVLYYLSGMPNMVALGFSLASSLIFPILIIGFFAPKYALVMEKSHLKSEIRHKVIGYALLISGVALAYIAFIFRNR